MTYRENVEGIDAMIEVKRSIDSEIAVEELINLIKENNDWIEP